MSDAYTEWCKEKEEAAAEKSRKKQEEISKTDDFRQLLEKQNKIINEAHITALRCCKTCKHNLTQGKKPHVECKKLAVNGLDEFCVCDYYDIADHYANIMNTTSFTALYKMLYNFLD